MSSAVLVATAPAEDGSPAALLAAGDECVLTRLIRQAAGLGARATAVVTRPEWVDAVQAVVPDLTVHAAAEALTALRSTAALVAANDGPVVVVDAAAVMHDAVLALLLGDPRIASGVVTAQRPGDHAVRVDHGRVTGVTAAGGTAALGVLKVAAADADALAGAATAGDSAPDDVLAGLLDALVASGAAVAAPSMRGLFHAPVSSPESAAAAMAAMAAVDEDRALLDAAVKEQDGFFTTFFVSPYSKYIARWAARRGMTPNQVTTVSMALGVAAATAFAEGSRTGLVAGAVLLQVAFTTDCVDGQLARYTRQFSAVGAWLDSVFDRAKEYVAFAGLALGAVRTGDNDTVWLLAAAALALQTVRHTVDFGFAAARPVPATTPPAAMPAGVPSTEDAPAAPAPATGARLGRLGVQASVAFERRPALKWLKRIVVLPIGERFALISLTAALAGPRTTFVALLVWGTLAMAYTATGRVLRALVA